MNPCIEDRLIKLYTTTVYEEIAQISLEEQACQSGEYRPSWFSDRMQAFGQWLIQMGLRIESRYKKPSQKYQSTACNFAQ